MQARAIFEAACDVAEGGHRGRPGGDDPARRPREGARRCRPRSSARSPTTVFAEQGVQVRLPRRHHDRGAARRAHRRRDRRDGRVLLLRHQRPDADDARHVARRRRRASSRRTCEHEIYARDPFADDRPRRRRRADADRGRARAAQTQPKLKIGICGEHGGDPASVEFCHEIGLDYVSLLAVPRADRAPGGGAGGARRAE